MCFILLKKNKRTLYAISLLLFVSSILIGQESEFLQKDYFVLPHQIDNNEFRHIVGVSTAILPEDFIEEASDYLIAPLFGYSVLYGLPSNFLLDGNIRTNIITFQFSAGAKWSYSYNKFSLALGYDIAYVFGQLKKFGFNSKINSWINYPNLTIGYEFNKTAVSLMAEAIIITSLTEYADDVEISNETNQYSGMIFSAFLEQPLWKDHYLSIGLKLHFTNFYYPSWAAYSTFDRYYWIPEFNVGLVL
jgi:hypothetical protein